MKNTENFIHRNIDWPYQLMCPICGNEWIHHSNVEVFERPTGEDGISVIYEPETHYVRTTTKNPSGRRNAVKIWFWGECSHTWSISILQHKGNEYIEAGDFGEVDFELVEHPEDLPLRTE